MLLGIFGLPELKRRTRIVICTTLYDMSYEYWRPSPSVDRFPKRRLGAGADWLCGAWRGS